MSNPGLFRILNRSGCDKLSFDEALTFFYMLHTGRPLCDGCGILVLHTYFTCVKCFDDDEMTFNVCASCFHDGNYVHIHDHFLDNFLTLETQRREIKTLRNRPLPPPPKREGR